MTTAVPVRESWRRIEEWLSANVPPLVEALRPPASADAIARAEATLGKSLPQPLKDSLAIHDGQYHGDFQVFCTWEPRSLARIVEKWQMLSRLTAEGILTTHDEPGHILTRGPVRPRWWDPAWIPIASDGTGDLLCADLVPAEGGSPGQIVLYGHDRPHRDVVAADYGKWLSGIADEITSGRFFVVDGEYLSSLR